MFLKARRLGGIIVLLTFTVHAIISIKTKLAPTFSEEVVNVARVYLDAASGWSGLLYFLSSAAWIFGGIAHGVFLTRTSRPQRGLALVPILGFAGILWSILAMLTSSPVVVVSAGREGPNFVFLLSIMLILFVIQFLDLILPPWSRNTLSRLQRGSQKVVSSE